MSEKYYLTTTLPYVNAKPHIGFALEIVQADVLARWQRQRGKEVFFNTGTDEHGLKIYQKAQEEKKDPQTYVDQYAKEFQKLKGALHLSYDYFIRTTEPKHIKAAQAFWQKCQENGDIYKSKQKVKYCVGCELEKTDSELVANRCPDHPNKEVEILEEENYFFRFSKYQQPLLDLYEKNPDFIVPTNRLKEIKNFVQGGLKDFSVSRLKEKLPWGIPVPNDPDHVMYVWFDALVNYISTLDWPEDEQNFQDWWPGIQMAGKDNLRQQSAMWQAMLMSAGLSPSKQIFIHGFVTSDGQKMSKSLGNVINPLELVEKYGPDPVRYYLLREIPSHGDGDFSERRFKELYNADLANGLGNLVARVAKLCETKKITPQVKPDLTLLRQAGLETHLEKFEFNLALEEIWKLIKEADILINQEKPWEKTDREAEKTLTKAVQNIINVGEALEPFLPQTTQKIKKQFVGPEIKSAPPLFPRLE